MVSSFLDCVILFLFIFFCDPSCSSLCPLLHHLLFSPHSPPYTETKLHADFVDIIFLSINIVFLFFLLLLVCSLSGVDSFGVPLSFLHVSFQGGAVYVGLGRASFLACSWDQNTAFDVSSFF